MEKMRFCYPPTPQPERQLSVAKTTSGSYTKLLGIMDIPLYCSANLRHHLISFRNSTESDIGMSFDAALRVRNRRFMNTLLESTHFEIKASFPINDCSSFNVAIVFKSHSFSRPFISPILVSKMCNVIRSVFISIPSTVFVIQIDFM